MKGRERKEGRRTERRERKEKKEEVKNAKEIEARNGGRAMRGGLKEERKKGEKQGEER